MRLLVSAILTVSLGLLSIQKLPAEPIRLSSIVSATGASSTPNPETWMARTGFADFIDGWDHGDLLRAGAEPAIFSTVSFRLEMFNKLGVMAQHVGHGTSATAWSPLNSVEATVLTRSLATERGHAHVSNAITESYK